MPQLSQKQDAVPGQFNSLVVTPTRTGTFPVICTELCGLGHALMRSHVDILTEAKFDAWLKGGGKAAAGAAGARRLPAERVRRLPHAEVRGRDR